MPESIRRSVRSITVVADDSNPELSVGGDYGQQLPDVGEGMADGAAAGAAAAGDLVFEDPRAIFVLPFLLPVLMVAGGVAGTAGAKIEKDLAEFREGLADEIVADGVRPLPSNEFARTVIEHLESSDSVESVTEDADATLNISVTGLSFDTANEDAIITAFVSGELTSNADGSVLYTKSLEYTERNSLRNWTANENALWNDYVVHARQRLAAELVADLFETVHVRNVLRPLQTESFTGGWSGQAKTDTPTLSWELFLLGGDAYEDQIDENDIAFDLRILDEGRLTYEARGINGTRHEVAEPLPGCADLRWSVRPVYQVDGETRAGHWMQYRSNTDKFFGHDARMDQAITLDFWRYYPEISTRCSS